jgi:hypothetical protein
MKMWMECVGTKHKLIENGSICSMKVVAPTFKTSSQSPFSNLFLKITPKLIIYMYDPTIKWREKVVTKVEPIIKVMVKCFETSVKS